MDEIAALAKTLRGLKRDLSAIDSRVEDAETKLEDLKKSHEAKPPKSGNGDDDGDGNPFK